MQLGLTAEQLAERRKGLGGSDVKRMLDDPVGLWREKLGLAEPEDLSGNLAVQMGSATEAFNAHWFTKVTGRPVGCRGELRLGPKEYPWMRANLDGMTVTREGRRAYWDAKHVGKSDEAMILRYTPQMTHCAIVCRVDWWVLSVFVGNSKHEIIEQEVDPFYAEELIVKEREFWNYVVTKTEPPAPTHDVLPPKPMPTLRTIDLSADFGTPEWGRLVDQYNWAPEVATSILHFSETEAAAKRHAISRDEIKSLVPDDVGTMTRGRFSFKRDKAGKVTMKVGGA